MALLVQHYPSALLGTAIQRHTRSGSALVGVLDDLVARGLVRERIVPAPPGAPTKSARVYGLTDAGIQAWADDDWRR